jgi:predicted HTH domain antitoxin
MNERGDQLEQKPVLRLERIVLNINSNAIAVEAKAWATMIGAMNVSLELPEELEAALRPNPERHVLESVLLHMVRRGVVSVARAGELLGFSRTEAVSWYTREGYAYPEYTPEEWADEVSAAQRLHR